MSVIYIGAALAGLIGVGIIAIGAHYLLAPQASAPPSAYPTGPTGTPARGCT